MTAFEHVATLLSFVYALALAHLLSRTGELIVERERVTFSGLTALGMVNVGVLIFLNWIGIWDFRSVLTWDAASIAVQFGFAIAIYMAAVLISPKPPEEGVLDMDAFFWRQRVYFYAAILVLLVMGLAANFDYLKSERVALFLGENAYNLVFFVPIIAALISRSRRVQWLSGISLTILGVGFTILFDATLH